MWVRLPSGSIASMIEVMELVKDYGAKRALHQLSFTARPGVVTGVVGPSGSGKSTALRVIVGVDSPTSGTALVNGKPHATHDQSVGTVLDTALPGGCTAVEHLRRLARSTGMSRHRVATVLDEAGLSGTTRVPIGQLSGSTRGRLRIASALLADPGVLLFDEPTQDLDAEDVQWARELLQALADQGRTVLVASKHMSEMTLTADQLLIIREGRLVLETSALALTERFQRDVFVRSPRRSGLARVLTNLGATVHLEASGGLSVTGVDAWRIASAAAEHHIPLQALTPRNTSLEEFYLQLTEGSVQPAGSAI
jgi:ABC-2 type transport system ATP-binding protein